MRVPLGQHWPGQAAPFDPRTEKLVYKPLRLLEANEAPESLESLEGLEHSLEVCDTGELQQSSPPPSPLHGRAAWSARLLAGVLLLVGPVALAPFISGGPPRHRGALRAGEERSLGSQHWPLPHCAGLAKRWHCRNETHLPAAAPARHVLPHEAGPLHAALPHAAPPHVAVPPHAADAAHAAPPHAPPHVAPHLLVPPPPRKDMPTWLWQAQRDGKAVLRGISYSPVPLQAPGRTVLDDDFMGNNTSPLWGEKGRRDLAIMRRLGANAVRMYGNDPNLDHSAFLDEAVRQGLDVIVGFSDYPYIQMKGNCMRTQRNCYSQVRRQYKKNLRNGFLSGPRTYHKALRTIVLMNEPDLKMESGFIQGLPGLPRHFLKAMLSSLDAVLDAEKEAGIVGRVPNFTVAFSFAKCQLCSAFKENPALGQMWELRNAMRRPRAYGYVPKNNLWLAYNRRFVNSFNTANSAHEVKALFLEAYDAHFKQMPVFIGEYHSPYYFDQQVDLEEVLELAANKSSRLGGICFFEFQVRYDKGGGEMNFGMFGLDFRKTLSKMVIADQEYHSWCLRPMPAKSKSQCGLMEADTIYEGRFHWSLNLTHIPSAEMCCARCHEHTVCQSWTWVKASSFSNVSNRCTLWGAKPTLRVRKLGVVSGSPAQRRSLLPATSRSEDAFVHTAVQRAYGGQSLDWHSLCPPQTLAGRV